MEVIVTLELIVWKVYEMPHFHFFLTVRFIRSEPLSKENRKFSETGLEFKFFLW